MEMYISDDRKRLAHIDLVLDKFHRNREIEFFFDNLILTKNKPRPDSVRKRLISEIVFCVFSACLSFCNLTGLH